MPKTIVIIGPPGTGKTSSAVTVTKGWLDSGIGYDQVAYLAFTRAAAKEAVSRIKDEAIEEIPKELPYFRTVHSLAYRGLRRAKEDLRVVTMTDMKNFSLWSGFEGTFAINEWEDLAEVYQRLERGGRSDWDDCLSAYTLSRISAMNAEELELAKLRMSQTALKNIGLIEEKQYQAFVKQYEIYKKSNGLVDFTDMLEFALTEMTPLDNVKRIVVDEVQDNARLIFAVTDRLFQNAEEHWLAGDPNQAIYRFAASDARLFISRARSADHRIVLRQTHRFGKEIVDFSRRIIERSQDRVLVDVFGVAGRRHKIHMTGQFKPTVGSMLILHRHVMGCQDLGREFYLAGLPYRNERGRDPMGSEMRTRAFMTIEDLAEGKKVGAGAVARLVEEFMPSLLPPAIGFSKKPVRLVIHGAKKRIQDGIVKGEMNLKDCVDAKILTQEGADVLKNRHYRLLKYADDLEFYHRVHKNGYSLEGQEIPVITTIHGSKGRQAPSVVIFSEMGLKCTEDMDSEHRLAYVASTRTQGDLEVCAENKVDWANKMYDYPVEEHKKKKAEEDLF